MIYTVVEESLPTGDVIQYLKIKFVAVGIRKEGDKGDIYRLAQKLIEFGIINVDGDDDEGKESSTTTTVSPLAIAFRFAADRLFARAFPCL